METLEKTTHATGTTTQPFHAQDLLQLVAIGSLAMSPDGSSIVYVRRTVEEGRYVRRLWRTSYRGGRPDQLTAANANDGHPSFSPDGKSLVFISDRSGKPQAWVMSLSGGEPNRLTDLPGGVGAAQWSPDGRRLLLLAGSGEKRFLVGSQEDPVARRIRDYTWRLDGVGYRDEFTSAWVVELAGGEPRRVTAPSYNVESAAWSPDGKRIAFLADRRPEAAVEEFASLWVVDSDAANAEPEQKATLKGAIVNLAWAPSEAIGFLGVDKERAPGWANIELHVLDGARARQLAADRDLNIQNSSYGDYMDVEHFGLPPLVALEGRRFLGLVAHRGASHPYRFGADGEVTALAEPDADCLCIAAAGDRVAVVASDGGPSDVYAVEDGKLRELTGDGSRWFGPFRQPIEHFAVPHPDGHTLDVWLLRAGGDRTSGRLVLDVHGGPHASFGNTPWLEMNALASAGINVVWSNPRGSASYGEAFTRAVAGRWGAADSSDLLRVLDWAVEQGLAERDRVGIMGLSYGGFMTNWMLGHHPGVFAAAVSENPVSDMLAEYASADFGRTIGRAAVGADNPWEHAQEFLDSSPWFSIHRNHAPLLLLQAESDFRCPAVQSEMLFTVLRSLGREVEMIRYPGESHVMLAIGRPDRRVDRIERIVGWFEKHLTPTG
jgi:acylaminoacyl-peptidase